MNIISITIMFFAVNILFALDNQRIETPKYNMIFKTGRFEIRYYESMILATTAVKASYREATYTGFKRIAQFIFGKNSANLAIAMTAPVMTTLEEQEHYQSYKISFVMPKEFTIKSLPKPLSEDIEVRSENLGLTAVINFGGWATDNRVKYLTRKLKKFIETKNYKIIDPAIVAQYNSPWAIPPFRHNEIIIKIKERKAR
ncbi:MAG: hypothetical protein CMG75_03840 [Candidatus Marinimicrobia bacterium]|nr:hypothetical protein [Candidatus Neomarinimicrobiota bacterium]